MITFTTLFSRHNNLFSNPLNRRIPQIPHRPFSQPPYQGKYFRREVKLLSPEVRTLNGTTKDTSLIQAVIQRDANAIATISQTNPQLIRSQTSNDNTPIHEAAKRGDAEMIRTLIDVDSTIVNLKCHCYLERTPLHYAAEGGHKDATEALFEAGANPNIQDEKGRTPLDVAIENGHMELAAFIHDNGGKANKQTAKAEQFTSSYKAKKHTKEFMEKVKTSDDSDFQLFMEELRKK